MLIGWYHPIDGSDYYMLVPQLGIGAAAMGTEWGAVQLLTWRSTTLQLSPDFSIQSVGNSSSCSIITGIHSYIK